MTKQSITVRVRKLFQLPPKSGLKRMSYPFSSLSTVSFTNDILLGSLTLEKEAENILDVKVSDLSSILSVFYNVQHSQVK